MKHLLHKAKTKATQVAADLRPDAASVKNAADLAVDTATRVAQDVSQLGREALKTDMAKDAAAGAAIGAVLAVPVPVIGPVAGAVVGAGLGVYKNLRQGGTAPRHGAQATPPLPPAAPHIIDVEAAPAPVPAPASALDKYDELTRLHELKVKGVLTDEEFSAEKKKILDR